MNPADYGVHTNFRTMPNGEVRLGLVADDGSAYTRTISAADAWQNSHYHLSYTEIYVVQTGCVVLATLVDEALALTIYEAGQHFIVPAGMAHNIFQTKDAVTHNVKFGGDDLTDWHAVATLDDLVQALTKKELF